MEILQDFGVFIYGVCKSFLGISSFLLSVYLILYFIARFLVCGNSKSDFKTFKRTFNEFCMNYLKALNEISYAHLNTAKLWAETRILRNNKLRKDRNIR